MAAKPQQIYEFGTFRLDLTDRLLTKKDKPVALTPKAFEVLVWLVERRGHLVEKEELLKAVWPDSFVEEGNLSRTIWMLRQALGDDRNGHGTIQTVPKHGYRFVAEVKTLEAAAENGNARSEDLVMRQDHPAAPQAADNGAAHLERSAETQHEDVLLRSELETGSGVPIVVGLSEKTDEIKSNGGVRKITAGPERSYRQRYRWPLLAIFSGVLLTAVLASVYIWQTTGDSVANAKLIRSIAVLSLENLSGNKDEDYFSEGMTEILVTELGKIHDLTVIDRGATRRYKDTDKSIVEIARELNVDAIATGSAMRSDNRARITLRLYRADSGESIWSESFERDSGNALALQGSIAKAIAEQIKVKLSAQETIALAAGRSANADAQDAFLRGLFAFSESRNISVPSEKTEMTLKSVGLFERAIASDPKFADAYAMRAKAFSFLAGTRPEFWPKVKESATKAIQLDDLNAAAHYALANVAFRYEFDRVTAQMEYGRANELVPNFGEGGPGSYALFLSSEGKQEEAIAAMKKAMVIAPFSIGEKNNVGNFYIRAGRYDEAIEWLQKVLQISPKHSATRLTYAQALACKGRYPEAIAEAGKAIENSGEPGQLLRLAWIHARAGANGEAIRILDEVMSSPELEDPGRGEYDAAGVYAELGEKDKAISSLEKAFTGRALPIIWLKVSPEFKNLHGDPRYEEMVRRLGLSR